MSTGVDSARLGQLLSRERSTFTQDHPQSAKLFEQAQGSLHAGVPMSWMSKWPGAFPVFIERAAGAHFHCVDGLEYLDFCLGDTGAMCGHSPPEVQAALAAQAQRGLATMLPTAHAARAGAELKARFGLPRWQFTLTATDANRHAIRYARQLTARPKILIIDWCYHGTVDEAFANLIDGEVRPRAGNIGPPVDPAQTTCVVAFNDLPAIERALATGEIAAVLLEPAMTNIGIVLPDQDYHAQLRRMTRAAGTWLIIDETHTLCAGPGGCTAAWGLDPDFIVLGKTIGGGIPAAAFGFTEEISALITAEISLAEVDVGGIGGTLAGNPLSMALIATTLTEVLTPAAFEQMEKLAISWTEGVSQAIAAVNAPWQVTRLGCRAEYSFLPQAPRTGAQAAAADDFDLQQYLHLYALNRGILLTPFHNMALMSPATTEEDVARHSAMFADCLSELFAAT